MAARDVKLYFSLKKAIKEKVANPALPFHTLEVDGALRAYDYDYIFQTARRVFPQKYNLGHSYLHGTPISNLQRDDLRALNMEYAKALVEGWGGTDETQINQRELDPVLVEYENELTAPDEHDSLYEDLNRNALSEEEKKQEEEQAQERQEEGQESPGGQPARRQPPPRYIIPQRPGLSPEMEEKLTKANQSMQSTKAKLAGENPPQLSEKMGQQLDSANKAMQRGRPVPGEPSPALDRMSQRLNSATRMRPTAPLERPTPRIRAGRSAIINSRNRRQALAPFLKVRGANVPGLGGTLVQWGLEKAAWKLASNVARTVANAAARGIAELLPRLGTQAALQAGRSAVLGAGTFLAGGGGALLMGILTVILGAFALYWLQQKDFEDCGKPGTMNVIKSAKKGAVEQGETIQYELLINYKLNCGTAQADNVEVRDTLSPETPYDESLTSASSTEIVDPFQPGNPSEIGNPQINPIIPAPANNPNNLAASGLKPTLEDNTLVWKLGTLFPNRPVILNFAVRAPASDTWISNQATVTYTTSIASVSGGGGFPPTKDNCSGKYDLKNPIGNFGDPNCDFDQDKLSAMLQQLDPAEAAYWFTVLIPKETVPPYNPNSYNPGSTSGRGAYGLFQMNPDNGKETYDRGDVDWQRQVSNAINYNNILAKDGRAWCYWEAAKPRWAPKCYP